MVPSPELITGFILFFKGRLRLGGVQVVAVFLFSCGVEQELRVVIRPSFGLALHVTLHGRGHAAEANCFVEWTRKRLMEI